MIDEMITKLREFKSELMSEATNEKIKRLEQELKFYENDCKQKEIQIIRLETRLAEIRNLLNGANDNL